MTMGRSYLRLDTSEPVEIGLGLVIGLPYFQLCVKPIYWRQSHE